MRLAQSPRGQAVNLVNERREALELIGFRVE